MVLPQASSHLFLSNEQIPGDTKVRAEQLTASLSAFQSPRRTCHTSAVFLFRIITVSRLSGGVALAGAHDRCGSIWEDGNASVVDGHPLVWKAVCFVSSILLYAIRAFLLGDIRCPILKCPILQVVIGPTVFACVRANDHERSYFSGWWDKDQQIQRQKIHVLPDVVSQIALSVEISVDHI